MSNAMDGMDMNNGNMSGDPKMNMDEMMKSMTAEQISAMMRMSPEEMDNMMRLHMVARKTKPMDMQSMIPVSMDSMADMDMHSIQMSKNASVTKVSQTLIAMMNDGLGSELQVAIQYMLQHIEWSGVPGFTISDEIQKIAIQEMQHFEKIAERVFYLGGMPVEDNKPVHVGSTLREMLTRDAFDEESAIRLYKQIITQATMEGDEATAHLFREILAQEEDHHDTFTTLLERCGYGNRY